MLGGTAYAAYICKQKLKQLIHQQNVHNSL